MFANIIIEWVLRDFVTRKCASHFFWANTSLTSLNWMLRILVWAQSPCLEYRGPLINIMLEWEGKTAFMTLMSIWKDVGGILIPVYGISFLGLTMSQSAEGPCEPVCVGGSFLPNTFISQPCSLWRLEIRRELGIPSRFPSSLTHCSWLGADSLLAQGCAWLTNWEHYVVGGNGASQKHGQPVVFLHWALHSSGLSLTSLSMTVFTQCLGLLTHPGFPLTLLTCLRRWLDSALGSLLPVSGLELTNDADCIKGFGWKRKPYIIILNWSSSFILQKESLKSINYNWFL